jgi:hypothetical protein
VTWEQLVASLPPSLEAVGLAHDEAGADGQITAQDHGDAGCVLLLDDAALAKRIALALAKRCGSPVLVYEVVGTSGGKHNRFRAQAFKAQPTGELRDAEGQELPLDDPSVTWGTGGLPDQAARVLRDYAVLASGASRTLHMGYKERPAGRPSTPRVGTLLTQLKKARSHEFVEQPNGRFELRFELAAGGKQISYCTAAERDELVKLLQK